MRIECAEGDQPVRCQNRGFCARHPSAVPSGVGVLVGGLVVFPSCVGVGDVMCCDVVCDVMWWAAGCEVRCSNLTRGEVL